MKKPAQPKAQSSRYDEPIQVDATPEQLIQTLVNTPPKKPAKWRFLRRNKRSRQ